jgi:hypothetical protein
LNAGLLGSDAGATDDPLNSDDDDDSDSANLDAASQDDTDDDDADNVSDQQVDDANSGTHGGAAGTACACPKRSKHVALAFYGLTRSLQYTIESIKQNVMAPLSASGYTFDTYLHTYDLLEVTNARSGEAGEKLNTSEWRLLEPTFHKITSQVRIALFLGAGMLLVWQLAANTCFSALVATELLLPPGIMMI